MAMSAYAGGNSNTFGYMLRGLQTGAIGWAIGAAAVMLVRSAGGNDAWSFDYVFVIGYPFALCGWLLGVGLWQRWAREWFGFHTKPGPTGVQRYFTFSTDHKVIGIQYMVTFLVLFLTAGFFAMLIRAQLLNPEAPVFDNAQYNRIMSMHGIIMIAIAMASVIGDFGNYFVPLMIGAKNMAFPRLNALSF